MAATTSSRSRFYSFEFIAGALITIVICLAVLLSDVLFPGGAEKIDLMARLARPFASLAHPFGTDTLGRDVLARVVAGGRISLTVGLTSVIGGVVLGVLVGLAAGYYRGIWDMLLMRFANEFEEATVPDPYYGGPEGFGKVLDYLEDACQGVLELVRKRATQYQAA